MKIEKIGEPKVVLYGEGIHNYFAWPSMARGRDDSVFVACSGFRIKHICPFGKAVMAVSKDEGKSFCPPQIVIDTCLDDRDVGLCAFGKSGLILTSFNNSVKFQKRQYRGIFGSKDYRRDRAYVFSYLRKVKKEDERKVLGATFKVSMDNGVTFGPLFHSPITSPHGPTELNDGTILWVGRTFSEDDSFDDSQPCIQAYTIDACSGKMKYLSTIDDIFVDGQKILSCEPHALQLPGGKIVCHIRVEKYEKDNRVFTLYQCHSLDNGKSWTKPYPILDRTGGAPAHLFMHSSGLLVSVYGYRNDPPAIKAIVSSDEGETWSEPQIVCDKMAPTWDMGYPSSVELSDGSVLTAFYAHSTLDGPANILLQKWRIEL